MQGYYFIQKEEEVSNEIGIVFDYASVIINELTLATSITIKP